MPAEPSSKLTAVFLLNWKVPSENQIRYKHWSGARKFSVAAKVAWLQSLRSSPAGVEQLMTIISRLAQKPSETLLRQASVLTMATGGSDGNAAPCKPKGKNTPL